jgi:hypothetical protein
LYSYPVTERRYDGEYVTDALDLTPLLAQPRSIAPSIIDTGVLAFEPVCASPTSPRPYAFEEYCDDTVALYR